MKRDLEQKTPIDLWKLIVKEGQAKKIDHPSAGEPDSLLAVYKDRLTYTFILGKEVASIHFDRLKRAIYFRGHNIKNFELSDEQIHALNGLKSVLKEDARGEPFFNDYDATLGAFFADNKSKGRSLSGG